MNEVSEKLMALWQTAERLEQEMGASGVDAVEGRRFLLRMLAASVETYVENSDVDRPCFQSAAAPIRKMFADCPDTDYLRSTIALGPGRAYRISGRVPKEALYVGILLYGKGGRIGNRLTDHELEIDADGRFEVRISTEEQPGTWLRGDGDETAVLVRQYFSNRATQAAIEVNIDYLGKPHPPQPLSPEALTASVGRAERMLRAIFKRTKLAHEMATSTAVNKFIEIPGEQLFPTPDNSYCVAWYRMGNDKRLTVSGRLPKTRYFSVTLYNAWLESYEYRLHQISLNHEQLESGPDGAFEITLSHDDPKGGNWLDTAGHDEGYVLVRALLLEGEMPAFELRNTDNRES